MSFTGVIRDDLVTRKRTDFHETNDGRVVVSTSQDISGAVEYAKALRAPTKKNTPWGEWSQVGHIPLVVWNELVREGRAFDDDALLAWLDGDGELFKTREGSLSK